MIKQNGRKIRCKARFADGVLVGTCSGGKQLFDLQLLPELQIPEETLKELAGLYRAEDGGLISIHKSYHLILEDFQTGAVRILYAHGPNRFGAGERLGVPLPIEGSPRSTRS